MKFPAQMSLGKKKKNAAEEEISVGAALFCLQVRFDKTWSAENHSDPFKCFILF